MHHHHVVGNLRDHAHVVRDEEHGAALLRLQLGDELQNFGLRGHVQRGGRLVADQEARLQDDGHRDHDALALPARKLMRVARMDARRVGQPHALEDRKNVRLALGSAPRGVGAQQLVDLLAAGEHRVQRRHRLLEHHAHAGAAQLAQPLVGGEAAVVDQLLARENHVAALEHEPLGQQPHHRGGQHRLARAGLAHDAQRAPGLDAQVELRDGVRPVGVGRQRDPQAAHFEDGGASIGISH